MKLTDLFKRKIQETPVEATTNPVEISKDLFIDDSEPSSSHTTTKSVNAGSDIDTIYQFLQSDFETRGYNDALTNPDTKYMEDNLSLIRHDLIIQIERSRTHYEDLLKEVEFHIGSRTRAGLVDLVEQLKSRRELITDRIGQINRIKEDALIGNGSTQRLTLSYQRGFMRGLAALTHAQIFINK